MTSVLVPDWFKFPYKLTTVVLHEGVVLITVTRSTNILNYNITLITLLCNIYYIFIISNCTSELYLSTISFIIKSKPCRSSRPFHQHSCLPLSFHHVKLASGDTIICLINFICCNVYFIYISIYFYIDFIYFSLYFHV